MNGFPNHEIALPADARVFPPRNAHRRRLRPLRTPPLRATSPPYLAAAPACWKSARAWAFCPYRIIQVSQGVVVMAQDRRRETDFALGQEIARRAGIDNSARLKWTDGPPRLPS